MNNDNNASTEAAPLTDTYIQEVPDKCDRIIWRGQYYHLPIGKAVTEKAKDGVRGEPARPWRDISELDPSDDEHWFLRKDGRGWVVDGPRAMQNHGGDEEDGWQWFCRCEHPPIEATAAAGLVSEVIP